MTSHQLRLPSPRLGAPLRVPDGVGTLLVGAAAAAALGALAVLHPDWWRELLTIVLVVNGIVIAAAWPRAAAVLVLLFLPFLALIRRLLIAETGWTQQDPLLLVAPLVVLFLLYRLFVVDKRPLAPDRLSKMVLVLLVLAFFGVFNPFGAGGVTGGLGGLVYVAVPLMWFFVGRELGDRQTLTRLMYAVVAVAVAIAAYGLYQTEFGSPPSWDIDWVQATDANVYATSEDAVGEAEYRPFATFSSNTEYSGYLGIAFVFAMAMLYHRRPVLALAAPMLGVAIFLAGGRSVMALLLFTAVVLTALRSRNRAAALIVVVLGIGLMYGAAFAFGPRLDRAAGLSGDPKVERQVGGLLHPLDPNRSTFLGHWENLWDGVKEGITNPIGKGTGATNLGGLVGNGGGQETDIDIADAFVNFGLGGFLFVAIIVVAFRTVFSRYLRGRRADPLVFATAGVLVITFGQWLQGGHYAASALTWFVLGWAVRHTRGSSRGRTGIRTRSTTSPEAGRADKQAVGLAS
jgi:ABC-type amino acid transport system permease subunit